MINPLKYILDLMLPDVCHVCGRHLAEGEEFICGICCDDLPRTMYHNYRNNPMELRFAGLFPFERATAHFVYNKGSGIANLVHDFKYRGYPSLAFKLGRIMASELLPTGFFSDVDMVMPVPMHRVKLMRRGYNQAELLAKGIARELQVSMGKNLYACKPHKTQTSMSHDERTKNMDGVFKVKNAEELGGRHILLVDDVCTTGATMRSAAMALTGANSQVRLTLLALCSPI